MDHDQRAKIGAVLRKRWADPAVRSNYMTHHTDPTVRAARSAALKARWNDPAERQKLVAAMNAARRRRREQS